MVLAIHILLGGIALLTGAWNIATTKGTQRHRIVGWMFVGAMAGLIVTSFAIYEVFGGLGPFHVMSIVSGATLILAIYFPLRRQRYKNWMAHHYMWITYSYVGLVMATGSHFFQYGPSGWSFWARALLYWGLPYAVGSVLIFWQRDKILGHLRAHAPAEDMG